MDDYQYARVIKQAAETRLKEVDDMTKCCICTQTFTSPRTLPCNHTFCLKCLESCVAVKKPTDKISCPMCRREYKIPVEGVKGFQRNLFAEKLAELAQTPDWASKESSCDVCRENAGSPDEVIPVAEKHCIQCQQNMCKDCAFHHRRNKITGKHEFINLEGLNEATLVTIKSKTCEKHPNKPLVVYCVDCFAPVCQLCFQESHIGHKYEDVKQRADKVKKLLAEDVANVGRLSYELNNLLNQELPKSMMEMIAKTEVDIHERSVEVKQIVDHHEKRLLEYLNIVKKRRHKEFSAEKTETEIYLAELESFSMMARELQEQGSIADLSSTGTMLMSKAKELMAKYVNVQKMLKTKANIPVTELVPVDIDSLVSYNSGNIIGKIKVNIMEKGLENDDNYYTYSPQYVDDDDPYTDCVFVPEPDSESVYESIDTYEGLQMRATPQPPLQPRQRSSATSSGIPASPGANSNLTEIQPSAVVLHDKLCRGKYTDIWLGKLNRSQDVSVKMFTTEATKQQWIVKSCDFFREAINLQKLSHPNIVKLIGVSTRSDPFYVITEFAANGFLDKYLKSEKEKRNSIQMATKDVINMATQIADAMYYLEAMKCIHRFLDTRSILVGANYSLKLANFEMAVIASGPHGRLPTHSDVYELIESPIKTRAPEVIESQRWSSKSDVWSFAIVIFEILTYDAKPYPGLSDTELMNRILTTHDFLLPAGTNFKYPDPKLRSIMESCWKKDPNERPDFKYLFERLGDFFKLPDFTGYMRRPKIIKALKMRGPVSGVTVLKEEMFIIRSESTTIDVFNASTFRRSSPIATVDSKKKLQNLLKRKQIQSFSGLQDITSCKKKGFIYVSSWQDCRIHQINPVLKSVTGSWEVKNGDPTTLAVTQTGNLLVSCASEGKVLEYTFDGKLVHEIKFGCNGDGPLHAVQYASERYVVCHGRRQVVRANEGVTIIDNYGNADSGLKSLPLPQPSHLAIDSNSNVLIAAKGRNKLILWNPVKGSHRVLISLDQEMKVPTRIHLNESTGQLLMLFRNNTLMIYQVKSTDPNYVSAREVYNDSLDDYSPYELPEVRAGPILPPRFLPPRAPAIDSDDYLYYTLPYD